MSGKIYFEVLSSLGKRIRVTKAYWDKIVEIKHKIIEGKEDLVKSALEKPNEVRISRKDPSVYLFYKKINGKYCCVVTKSLNGEGFIVTAYITDKIKIGDKYEAN